MLIWDRERRFWISTCSAGRTVFCAKRHSGADGPAAPRLRVYRKRTIHELQSPSREPDLPVKKLTAGRCYRLVWLLSLLPVLQVLHDPYRWHRARGIVCLLDVAPT